jgi:hypothetical protein
VNVSFNIGRPIPPHILDQFDIYTDISKGSSDTPKEATLINDKDLETTKPLEPQGLNVGSMSARIVSLYLSFKQKFREIGLVVIRGHIQLRILHLF